ncbi:unnamed protein product, partial [Staurois parvus]
YHFFLHAKPGTDCAGVPGPFKYLENALHAFWMMKKGSGQHRELEEEKKISIANTHKRDLPRLQAFCI